MDEPNTQDPKPKQPDYYYDDYQPVSLLAYVNVLLRHRMLIVACFLLASTSAYIVSKLATPVYEATAQFISDPNAASNVAIAGADMGVMQLRNPVDYYSNVLKSSAVLDKVLDREFFPQTDSGSQSPRKLIDLLDLPVDSPAPRQLLARDYFKDDLVSLAASTRNSSVLNLKTQWSDPQMAADLANAFLEELVAHDRRIKSATVKQKREFIETRLNDTEELLRQAEENLRDFKMQNRLLSLPQSRVSTNASVNVPPQLQLEMDRRKREVQVQSELYMTLKKELELAKIAENNEASTLAVIERATVPLQRIKPKTRTNVMLAAVVGLMLGVGFAFVIEYVAKSDTESEDTKEFLAHMASLRSDLRKLAAIFSLGLISFPPPSKRKEKFV